MPPQGIPQDRRATSLNRRILGPATLAGAPGLFIAAMEAFSHEEKVGAMLKVMSQGRGAQGNAQAGEKELKGEQRKTFMSRCLSD